SLIDGGPPTSVLESLPLHDALPISRRPRRRHRGRPSRRRQGCPSRPLVKHCLARPAALDPVVHRASARPGWSTGAGGQPEAPPVDRKSTRLNSSHVKISYAVFGLKK